MNSDIVLAGTLVMVKTYQAVTREGIFPSIDPSIQLKSKMEDYLSALGFVVPNQLKSIDAITHLAPYMIQAPIIGNKEFVPKNSREKTYSLIDYCTMFVETRMRQAKDFCRRIKELARIFETKLDVWDEYRYEQLYLYLCLFGEIIPQFKYTTNLAFNKFWQEIPPIGSGETHFGLHLFPPCISVKIKRICGERGRRKFSNQVLMNTVFQGFKRGLLPCDPSIVQKTLNKHRKALSKEEEVSESTLDRVARLTRELMSGWTVGNDWKDTSNQSSSSTIESNYAKGGNIGYAIRELYGTSEGPGEFELLGFITLKGKFEQPVELRKVRPLTLDQMIGLYPDFGFQESGGENSLTLAAAPACILEPMKVRMITKPTVGLHTRLHKVQQSWHHYLRDHPCGHFELLGTPLTRELVERIAMHWQIGDKFGSGDYSAATDNLKAAITKTIVKELRDLILARADSNFVEELKNASAGDHKPYKSDSGFLLGHNLEASLCDMTILQEKTVLPQYEEVIDSYFKYQLENFQQKNGQLMGHVVSFVILCIANYCSYHISREKVDRKRYLVGEFSGTKNDVLINGDDILFCSKQNFYDTWLQQIAEFGFEPSIGKNYYNDKFLQVNSELWRFDSNLSKVQTLEKSESNAGPEFGSIIRRSVVLIPYINFGYLTNRRKMDCSKDMTVQRVGWEVSEESLIGRFKNLGKIYRGLTEGIPECLLGPVRELFDEHNSPVLRHFGVPFLRKYLFSDSIAYAIGTLVYNEKDPQSKLYRLFGDLSSKLDRGSLTFKFENVKLLKRIDLDFLAMDVEALFPIEKEEPQEWIKCGARQIKDKASKARVVDYATRKVAGSIVYRTKAPNYSIVPPKAGYGVPELVRSQVVDVAGQC